MSIALESPFRVRLATAADAPIIAGHRCRMFQDMGELPPPADEHLHARTVAYLVGALQRAEYVGWLASPLSEPETIVAGAGVQRRRALPHPLKLGGGGISVAEGRHGIVLNVYTEPAWRRRGLAELLMRRILTWAREERLERVVLHASREGRRLYERLGFVATNEMRFMGDLSSAGGTLDAG
jgi:GNAT superfamily N-acetyltransferase